MSWDNVLSDVMEHRLQKRIVKGSIAADAAVIGIANAVMGVGISAVDIAVVGVEVLVLAGLYARPVFKRIKRGDFID